MKALGISLLLLGVATDAGAQEFRLPFSGRWFVSQGGDTANVNEHMGLRAQWYGIDFAAVGGPSQRALVRSSGTTVEDFYCLGAPILSPVNGEVVAAVSQLPDNRLGSKDPSNAAGNHVGIKAAVDRYVYLAHFQQGSIAVKPGVSVTRGQVLGKCGNSGNSDFPHVHMHVQDSPIFNSGTGQNVVFSHINVELSGKEFRNVEWPLLRGLFVWNSEP
jgi:hypothetical protein